MNEVVSKFSSYNIFNYLVPGAALCLLMEDRGLLHLDRIDLAARLIVFYVAGMAISRAGSLVIDPCFKRLGMIARSNYADYVRASASDDKVAVLLETSNAYRTMASACAIGLLACLLSLMLPRDWLQHPAFGCAVIAGMTYLFALAYIKQNRAVTRRVNAVAAARPANDVTMLSRHATG